MRPVTIVGVANTAAINAVKPVTASLYRLIRHAIRERLLRTRPDRQASSNLSKIQGAPMEEYEIVVVGSGEAGKYLAWKMAGAGHRTALIERKLIGGSCPNIACLPSVVSKNYLDIRLRGFGSVQPG